jgi:hypothetical protein
LDQCEVGCDLQTDDRVQPAEEWRMSHETLKLCSIW